MILRMQRIRVPVEMESEIVLQMEDLIPNPQWTSQTSLFVLPYNDQSLQVVMITEEFTEEDIEGAQQRAAVLGLAALEDLEGPAGAV